MLIPAHKAPRDDDEWRDWLRRGHDFGQLICGADPWPVVVPCHFVLDGPHLLVHLSRSNPIWPHLEATGTVVLSVVGDDAYVPSGWRAGAGAPESEGVPTSYYAAVQLRCRAELLDDPHDKAALLATQLRHFQPEGGYAEPAVDGPHGRLLPAIRGMRLSVLEARASFTFDGHKPPSLQAEIAERLRRRGRGRDAAAAAEQLRRLAQQA
jgi:transcriptional regulator